MGARAGKAAARRAGQTTMNTGIKRGLAESWLAGTMISLGAITRSYYAAPMASIVIRNLDEKVAARLRVQARLRGVSVEREARRILAEGTAMSRAEIAARAHAIRARQKRHGSRAAQFVREDRER